MILSMSNQGILFLTTVVFGMAVGFAYDIFRVFRKIIKHANWVIYLEDALYWIFVSFMMFYFMLFKNYGEIRAFSIIGVFIGMVIYFFTISILFLKVSITVVNALSKVFSVVIRIIFFPIGIILKILDYPWQIIIKFAKCFFDYLKKVLQKSKRYAKIKGKKTIKDFKIILKKH